MVGSVNEPRLLLGTPKLMCVVYLYWGTGCPSFGQAVDVIQQVTASLEVLYV